MSDVFITKNYDIFKKVEGNRKLNEPNVVLLMDSITKKNMLLHRPILINTNMEIIDGQHRLEAARRLSLPIYYQIFNDFESSDVILFQKQQKWSVQNYFDFYAQRGNENYIKALQFIEKNKFLLNSGSFLIIFFPNVARDGYKEGALKFFSPEKHQVYQTICNQCKEIMELLSKRLIKKDFIKKLAFRKALVLFLLNDKVDFDRFFKRLEFSTDKIYRCSGWEEYRRLFSEIYNFGIRIESNRLNIRNLRSKRKV